jgi:hypothetical protein
VDVGQAPHHSTADQPGQTRICAWILDKSFQSFPVSMQGVGGEGWEQKYQIGQVELGTHRTPGWQHHPSIFKYFVSVRKGNI